jgi:hypothetical protein
VADYGDIVDVTLVSKHAAQEKIPELQAISSIAEDQFAICYVDAFSFEHLRAPENRQMSHPLENRTRLKLVTVATLGSPNEW